MIPGGIILTPGGESGARPGSKDYPQRGLSLWKERAPLRAHFSWNRTVTVNWTGLGRPLMIIGS